MTEQTKTPWRKNLDPRYISGEDLLSGMKGLRKEMVVTLARYEDAPTFDQKIQKEVDKTAIWLKDFSTGQVIYKPCILNVTRGKFLSNEIGNGSLFIDDFSHDKPFIMYAQPDKRHGHIVAFKKYYPPAQISDKTAIAKISESKTLEELKTNWDAITAEERKLPSVLALKEKLKTELQ